MSKFLDSFTVRTLPGTTRRGLTPEEKEARRIVRAHLNPAPHPWPFRVQPAQPPRLRRVKP